MTPLPPTPRDFPTCDVLSVVGDRLIAERGVSAMYDVLNFMTGESLYTHQLPRGQNHCRPEILRQHPELSGYDDSSVNRENWRPWADAQVRKYGPMLALTPLPIGEPAFDTPLADLMEMVQGREDKIIVLDGDSNG